MTAPWDSIQPPPVTGWWVRKERIGTAGGAYAFAAGSATGKRYQKGTASGAYAFAGTAEGERPGLQIQGANANNSNTVTIPTHAVGDLIVIYAFRDGSTTTPTKPSAGGTVPSWVDINNNTGANSCSSRTAQFVATATDHTSGTWTNATGMIAVVLRGQHATPIDAQYENGGITDASIFVQPFNAWPTINPHPYEGSVCLQFYGHRYVTAWGSPYNGYTRLAQHDSEVCLNHFTPAAFDAYTSQSVTLSQHGGFRCCDLWIRPVSPATDPSMCVSSNSVDGTSMTLPAHQAGDYIVMYAFRDGSATAPDLPGGWTNLRNGGANSCSHRFAYKVAASGSEVSGTWTNATFLICGVFRNTSGIGAHDEGAGSGTQIITPYLTLQNVDTSQIAWFGGHRSTDHTPGAASIVFTFPLRRKHEGASADGCFYDSGGPCPSPNETNWGTDWEGNWTSSGYMSAAIELKA